MKKDEDCPFIYFPDVYQYEASDAVHNNPKCITMAACKGYVGGVGITLVASYNCVGCGQKRYG